MKPVYSAIALLSAATLLAGCARRAGPGPDDTSVNASTLSPAGEEPAAPSSEGSGAADGSGASPTPTVARPLSAYIGVVERGVQGFDPRPEAVIAASRNYHEVHATPEARAEQQQRCDNGEPGACLVAGALAADGTAEGMDRLLRTWRRACEGGDDVACEWLASTLLQTGRPELVTEFLSPACNGVVAGARRWAACAGLAWQEWGRDAASAALATVRFGEACTAGYGAACRYLGDARMQLEDRIGAIAAWEEGCIANHGGSCIALGLAQRREALDPRPFEQACQLGYGAGCLAAGVTRLELGEAPADGSDVSTLLQRGCLLEELAACELLAEQLYVSESDRYLGLLRSTPWWVTSCNLGSATSCWNFAQLLLALDNEADATLIGELRQRACAGGVADACP